MANRVLPKPPIVGQNVAVLPDGNLDPQHATDCGESCSSSILEVHCGYSFSPGCIRQALGPAAALGYTDSQELSTFLHAMGCRTRIIDQDGAEAWGTIAHLRHHGHYAIMLGVWLGGGALHWMVAYERSASHVRFMDPWNANYTWRTTAEFDAQFRHQLVYVRP